MNMKRTARNPLSPNISCAPNYWSQGKPKWNCCACRRRQILIDSHNIPSRPLSKPPRLLLSDPDVTDPIICFTASYLETSWASQPLRYHPNTSRALGYQEIYGNIFLISD